MTSVSVMDGEWSIISASGEVVDVNKPAREREAPKIRRSALVACYPSYALESCRLKYRSSEFESICSLLQQPQPVQRSSVLQFPF